MRLISFEVLLEVLKKYGLDHAYEILETLFYEEHFMIINKDEEVIFEPWDTEDIFNFLENLCEKEVEP